MRLLTSLDPMPWRPSAPKELLPQNGGGASSSTAINLAEEDEEASKCGAGAVISWVEVWIAGCQEACTGNGDGGHESKAKGKGKKCATGVSVTMAGGNSSIALCGCGEACKWVHADPCTGQVRRERPFPCSIVPLRSLMVTSPVNVRSIVQRKFSLDERERSPCHTFLR